MGYRHSRDEMLDAATGVVMEAGLGALTFRAVGQRLGIPDRTVVYYFPTKDGLVRAVLDRTSADLQALLSAALGSRSGSEADLLRRSWTALATPAGDTAFRLYLQVVGLAVQGVEPYPALAAGLVPRWAAWVADRLTGDAGTRHQRAAAVVATLDGLLMIRAVAGAEAADTALLGLDLRP